MKTSPSLALAATLALTAITGTAQAAPVTEATMLDAVIVTPTARYSLSEWQARQASRHAVVLERVVVTPSARYTLTEWQQHQAGLRYAKRDARHGPLRGWLKMVWKHFEFARSQVEA